jgi:serine/threonine protein kinase
MSEEAIGKFQVLGTLGTGAHSTILHIRRQADGTSYALKVVPIDGKEELKFLEQAQHEYRVARMLSHPNIVRVHALEICRDWLRRVRKVHLLIEYVKGKTLDTCPPLGLPRLVQVFERVADGLCHMHRRQVFHADLKPNNILISRSGEVKIIDFGLAAVRGETRTRIQGTPEYMAPEQIRRRVANEQTDIFNFGATMYRMVTMRLAPSCAPTEGEDIKLDAKTWKRLLKPVQELTPGAPRALCDLIHRCMEFKPTDRPENMGVVQEALTHLAQEMVRSPEDSLEALEW